MFDAHKTKQNNSNTVMQEHIDEIERLTMHHIAEYCGI